MGPGMGVRSCMRVECVENVRERKVEKKNQVFGLQRELENMEDREGFSRGLGQRR